MLTIVGIDPGTTTGIAVIDLEGEVVAVESRKEMGLSGVTRYVMEQGTPVIVATDVSPAPSFVKRVTSAFGAELFVPDGDMSVRRKNRLTQNFSDLELTSHSMDALAAALQAYRDDKKFIDKVRRKTAEMGMEESEEVMKTALKERKSISKIIHQLKSPEEEIEPGKDQAPDKEVDWKSRYQNLKKEAERKEKENERLRDYVDELKERIEDLEEENRELSSDRQSQVARDKEVRRWKKRYERVLREKKELENRLKGIKSHVSQLTGALEEILKGKKLYRICNSGKEVEKTEEPVIFLHKKVREDPPEKVTVAVVSEQEDMEFYEERGIKTVLMESLPGTKLSNYYVVEEEEIFTRVDDRTEKFIDWLEGYRDRNDRKDS